MEQFITEIMEYAAARGVKPSTVVQRSTGQNARAFDDWAAGKVSPTVRTVERVREFMRAHPVDGARGSLPASNVGEAGKPGNPAHSPNRADAHKTEPSE